MAKETGFIAPDGTFTSAKDSVSPEAAFTTSGLPTVVKHFISAPEETYVFVFAESCTLFGWSAKDGRVTEAQRAKLEGMGRGRDLDFLNAPVCPRGDFTPAAAGGVQDVAPKKRGRKVKPAGDAAPLLAP